MAKRNILYPFPVYEAQFSNGARLRLSFASPGGKPIDFAAGRRAVEQIYFSDTGNDHGRTWYRGKDGAWRAGWPQRHAGVTVVRGFVEHTSIGRVEDTDEARWAREPVKATPRYNSRALIERARKALELGDAAAALATLRLA